MPWQSFVQSIILLLVLEYLEWTFPGHQASVHIHFVVCSILPTIWKIVDANNWESKTDLLKPLKPICLSKSKTKTYSFASDLVFSLAWISFWIFSNSNLSFSACSIFACLSACNPSLSSSNAATVSSSFAKRNYSIMIQPYFVLF